MAKRTFIKLTFLILLANNNYAIGQSNSLYIDSVNHYKIYVDSIIHSYYANPAPSLSHSITHYNCIGKNSGYGSGGSADLYRDPIKNSIYQLSYIKSCGAVRAERVYYFIKNKIVLAIINDDQRKEFNEREKYFLNDKYLPVGHSDVKQKKLALKYLIEGYEVLKENLY